MNIPIVLSEKDIRRFKSVYMKREVHECWPAFKTTEKGYGAFYVNQRSFRANRVAYFIAYGIDPGELEVCHTCDVRRCCNPLHLVLGTHSDNMLDATFKGKFIRVRFTALDIEYIYEQIDKGEFQHSVARYFGVDQSTISNILANRRKSPLIASGTGCNHS